MSPEVIDVKWHITLHCRICNLSWKDGEEENTWRDVLMQERQRLHAEEISCPYVFTWKGERIKQDIRRSFRRALRNAGLENSGVTLHTLRHTFAPQLMMAGVPLRFAPQLAFFVTLSQRVKSP